MLPGRGVRAMAAGRRVVAGNARLMEEEASRFPQKRRKAPANTAAGDAASSTSPWTAPARASSPFRTRCAPTRATPCSACAKREREPVLLTGDHKNAAAAIAASLGIGEYRAGCLPEDKLSYIDANQQSGKQICMIGDGVNDAPALKRAHVGVAMGGVGSDIAVDAADIALVNDDIREIPHLLRWQSA